METGVTPLKKPATSPAAMRSSQGASSGVWALTSPARRSAVQAKSPLFQSAPAAMRSSAVAASGFSWKRSTPVASASSGGTGHDVAVAGFGPRRHHADGDQAVVGSRGAEGEVGGLAEDVRFADPPVGVHREHRGLGIAAMRLERGPHERRGRRGGARLDEDVGLGQGEPVAQRLGEGGAGDDEDPLAGDEPLEPLDRRLGGGPGPVEREQLLRLARAC